MSAGVAILTNVFDSAGPPALEALVAEGYRTVCHSVSFSDPAARAAFDASGPNRFATPARDPEDLAREALERYGRIDVAVSNDAADPRRGDFIDKSVDDFRALLETFTVTPFRLAAAVLPAMKAQGCGRIIFLTSAAALAPSPGLAVYASARAATNAMVKSLAVEVAPLGISVNAIAPLLFLSNFFPGGPEDPDLARLVDQMIPMKRHGRPEEIGSLIGLLASGRADYISGQVIAFSGAGA
jgi:NAD(P)-dependent dehydrogenase (short-subunit alcohol dehydrogenase family)